MFLQIPHALIRAICFPLSRLSQFLYSESFLISSRLLKLSSRRCCISLKKVGKETGSDLQSTRSTGQLANWQNGKSGLEAMLARKSYKVKLSVLFPAGIPYVIFGTCSLAPEKSADNLHGSGYLVL